MRSSTALKNDIRKWLKERHDGEAKIVSIAEWKRRGERYGSDGKFVLVIDGSPLYACLNYGEDGWKASEELRQICSKHDAWFEQGYAWSVSFYEDH